MYNNAKGRLDILIKSSLPFNILRKCLIAVLNEKNNAELRLNKEHV